MDSAVHVAGLVQGYGRQPIINDLSFDIESGVVGLLGPNGAGKTTLLRTLSTVLSPRAGRISLLGRDLRTDADVRTVRRQVGYLPQEFGYYSSFTVYEFVRYCAWLRKVPSRQAHQATVNAIDAVELGSQAKSRMKNLSGGMLRRAGIAQAIVGDVRLVFLDEPTVGLDPEQRLAFRDLVRDVSTSATVVLSTHLVEDVAAVCEKLFILSAGKMVFSGSPEDLVMASVEGAKGDSKLERGYTSILRKGKIGAS